MWKGEYQDYVLDSQGVMVRKAVRLTLCPSRKPDGSKVTKTDARLKLQPHIDRVNNQTLFSIHERKTATFREFSDIWEHDYVSLWKPATQSAVMSNLRLLRLHWYERDMRSIGAGDVQRLIAQMKKDGKKPHTIRNVWGIINQIWKAALDQRYVDAVLPKPQLPRNVKPKPKYFMLDEVGLILANPLVSQWYSKTKKEFVGSETQESYYTVETQRAMYWLLAETGIRAGELAGLRCEDVQSDRITVNQSVWQQEAQTPKSDAAVRTIAISPQLSELLCVQVDRQMAFGRTFLFTNGNGSPLDMNVERRRRFKKVLINLGIEDKGAYHAFRHFNASMMDHLNVPLKLREERIGHAMTGSITMNVYTHRFDEQSNMDAAKRLGNELEKAMKKAMAETKSEFVPALSTLLTTHSGSDCTDLSADYTYLEAA